MRHPIIHKFISKLLNSPNSKGDYNYYFAIIKSKFIERACKRGNLELLKYFIIAKEYHVYQPLFFTDGRPPNRTALHIAAMFNQLEIVKYLIEEKGCDPNQLLPGGLTPLQEAASAGQLDVVKYLISRPGIRLDEAGEQDRCGTALYYAAFFGWRDIVAALIKAGANVNKGVQRAATGITQAPIETATRRLGAAQELTPLMGAVNRLFSLRGVENKKDALVQREIVIMLLAAGADPNRTKPAATTLLQRAVQYGDREIIRQLICRGVDVNPRGRNGATALMIACRMRLEEIVDQLIQARADVNLSTTTGRTPLYFACMWESVRMVRSLVKAGANPLASTVNYGPNRFFGGNRGWDGVLIF
ncbi:ankyrin repeat protein [Coxiella burnetii CbuK_Q154]|nr:ankyrin repeat protein [Coxiella burnetii CbuK_Q154]EAX33546.1 hypothetical protein A35_09715 [Coxiella burnetii 'MSU Goat Q177']